MGQFKQTRVPAGVSSELSMLRHELANVVSGLAGMTQLLKSSRLEPEQLHWLEAIEESTAQARFLLGTTSSERRSSASPDHQPQPVNGVRLLEQATMAHTPAVLRTGGRLLLELSTGLSTYWRVEARILRQVLDNLLANAVKFAPGTDILLSAQDRDDSIVLFLQDGGSGVPPELREQIFETGDRGVGFADIPGSGMGLALCRELVARMNGTIACDRAAGGGAGFEVVLGSASFQERYPTRSFTALSGLHCCLELEPCLERIIGKMLERLGVSWSIGRGGQPSGAGRLVLAIGTVRGSSLPRPSHLLVQPVNEAEGVSRLQLPPPVLESALHRALLRQVLAWRWAVNSPGEAPG